MLNTSTNAEDHSQKTIPLKKNLSGTGWHTPVILAPLVLRKLRQDFKSEASLFQELVSENQINKTKTQNKKRYLFFFSFKQRKLG
jgi:hypothetical protein